MDTSYYNRFGAEELTRRLSSETLLAQGPMGSVLLSEYDAADIPPAFWNLAEPQTVSRIHRLYVAAGAQVLITNTFQASSYALKHDQIAPSVAEVNRGAVDDARQAHPQLLLGSMGPIGIEWFAEDSVEYREIRGIAREQAHALLNAGVDGLLIETVTSIRNLQPTLAGARDAADGMPVLVSFVVDDKGDLLGDGLNIEAAVLYAEKHGANSVGVNCCSLAAANAAVPRMVASATTPVTVRPNVGDPVQTQDGPVWHENPEAFARACIEWRHAGAAMVGFLGTRLGLSIRATGDNAAMVRASSINPAFTITVGLCISGALTALSGGLLAQYQKSCDINVGTGMVTIALASLIIGETLVGKRTMVRRVLGVVFGSCLYRFIVAVALRFNVPAAAMKLVSAIIVAVAISMPAIQEKIAFEKRRSAARQARKERV